MISTIRIARESISDLIDWADKKLEKLVQNIQVVAKVLRSDNKYTALHQFYRTTLISKVQKPSGTYRESALAKKTEVITILTIARRKEKNGTVNPEAVSLALRTNESDFAWLKDLTISDLEAFQKEIDTFQFNSGVEDSRKFIADQIKSILLERKPARTNGEAQLPPVSPKLTKVELIEAPLDVKQKSSPQEELLAFLDSTEINDFTTENVREALAKITEEEIDSIQELDPSSYNAKIGKMYDFILNLSDEELAKLSALDCKTPNSGSSEDNDPQQTYFSKN